MQITYLPSKQIIRFPSQWIANEHITVTGKTWVIELKDLGNEEFLLQNSRFVVAHWRVSAFEYRRQTDSFERGSSTVFRHTQVVPSWERGPRGADGRGDRHRSLMNSGKFISLYAWKNKWMSIISCQVRSDLKVERLTHPHQNSLLCHRRVVSLEMCSTALRFLRP